MEFAQQGWQVSPTCFIQPTCLEHYHICPWKPTLDISLCSLMKLLMLSDQISQSGFAVAIPEVYMLG